MAEFAMLVQMPKESVDWINQLPNPKFFKKLRDQVWGLSFDTFRTFSNTEGDVLSSFKLMLEATDRGIMLTLFGNEVEYTVGKNYQHSLNERNLRFNCDKAVDQIFKMFAIRDWNSRIEITPSGVNVI